MSTSATNEDTFHCPLCNGTVFRRSRLTFADLPRLILLEVPLRCQQCGERANVLLPKAMKALAASSHRRGNLES